MISLIFPFLSFPSFRMKMPNHRFDPILVETAFLTYIRSRSFCKGRKRQARSQARWTPGSWSRAEASRRWRWRVMATVRPAAGRRRAKRPVREASGPGQGPGRPTQRPTIRRAAARNKRIRIREFPRSSLPYLTRDASIISHSPFSTCLFSKRTGRLRLDRRGDAAYIGRNEDSLVFLSHPLPFASLSFRNTAAGSFRAGKRILLLVVGGSNLFFETARPIHSPPLGTSLLFPISQLILLKVA